MSDKARSFVLGVRSMVVAGAWRIEDEYPAQARELLALIPAIEATLAKIPKSAAQAPGTEDSRR